MLALLRSVGCASLEQLARVGLTNEDWDPLLDYLVSIGSVKQLSEQGAAIGGLNFLESFLLERRFIFGLRAPVKLMGLMNDRTSERSYQRRSDGWKLLQNA